MKFKIINLIALSSLSLVACEKASTPQQVETDTAKNELKYLKEFETWKKTQNAEKLKQYESFFANKLKKAPTLYELTVNSHPLKKECEQYRFALPPEKHWKNLLPALQLIEKLNDSGLYANFKIVSVYRSQEANTCVKGAKASKHLMNYAVDFQTLDENFKHYPNHAEMDEKLCRFWRKEGKQHRLGLGLYGKQRYHIDTQGYRTWGVGFRSVSSPCLKPKALD
ncbi:hypothetical protein G9F32_05990 [Acinetobacter sp. 194]|uniref:D-Ala-D-Ala carboxypeptidase family metallohydrolase n=1 Tax=Acinetobacter shaoyimingii TaxID=2715164 RepID=UPI00140AA0A2|nr:D-Ala-D-Ala carboxypeptidase family metallohydrolase [Acinetobacter shaoyimingii]NHB57590.1 hypothetical protein [Acinetobacter shaoyimingii]